MKLRLPLSLASFLIAALVHTSFADNYTWSGNAGNNAWSSAGNWTPAGIPGNSSGFDEAAFNDISGSDSTIQLSSTVRLNKLSSTISGQKKLTLAGGTLLLGGENPLFDFNGDMTLSLTGAIALQSNLTIRTNLSNVLIEGSSVFNTGDNDILIDASAGSRVEIARALRSSTTKMTKDGEGTLKLLASNQFSGGVEVKAGHLHVGHDNALGTGALILGDQANPTKSVGMEALNADRIISNNFTWVNNALYITGQHGITLDSDSEVRMSGDRSIDVAQYASLTFGGDVTFTGSGRMRKTGDGTLYFRGTDNSFTGFVIEGGTVYAGAGNGHFTLGSADAGHTPLGSGKITVTGSNSVLQLSPGNGSSPGGYVSILGEVALNYGAVFEVLDKGKTILGNTSLLDGGTNASSQGAESLFIFRGDVQFDGGALVNSPNFHIGNNSIISGSGMGANGGRAGTVTIGFDDISGDTVTLNVGSGQFVADEIEISEGSTLILGTDNQINGPTALVLKNSSLINTLGYSASFTDLSWTDSTVWTDSSKISMSHGNAAGAGNLHFSANNIQGGSGALIIEGWVEGMDSLTFNRDVSTASWFHNIIFYGYNDSYSNVIEGSGSSWEIKPEAGPGAGNGVFVWNSQAYRGPGVSKTTNNDAALGGNWDVNRVPFGNGIELQFSSLDPNLTGKTINLDMPSGQMVLGKLTIADDVTGIFTIAGSNTIKFDNGASAARLYVGTKTLTGSSSYKVRNNIELTANGLVYEGLGGTIELSGNITGSGDITVTGTTGVLDLRGTNSGHTGDYVVQAGTLKFYKDDAAGTGDIIMQGGGLGSTKNNGSLNLDNKFVIQNDFSIAGGTTRFQATGNAAHDRIDLAEMRTISGGGSFIFEEGRNLQGNGGLILQYGNGVVSINNLAGNSNFKGGLVLGQNTNYFIGESSSPDRITSDIVFGAEAAGSNYAGTGDITFNGGGNFFIVGGSGNTVDFRNNIKLTHTGSSSSLMRFHGGLSSIKFTGATVSGALSFAGYGAQVFEIGDLTFLNNSSSFSVNMASTEYGSQAGDVLFKSLDDVPNREFGSLNRFTVNGIGYTTTIDQSISKLKAGLFNITGGRLALTNNDQVAGQTTGTYASLTLGTGSIVSSKGVSNTFGDLSIGGAATFELGDNGQLTFGRITNWTILNGTPYLINVENNTGIWNTINNATLSNEHIWTTSDYGWTSDRLAQIGFTGYTRGAVLRQDGARWEIVPDGLPAFEWSGGNASLGTSWDTTANWFANRRPTMAGDIAIFRDLDENLDGKTIILGPGSNTLSQINFEGTKDASFTIASGAGDSILNFAGNGERSSINFTGSMIPTISAAMTIDQYGLAINHNSRLRLLTLSGVISDANSSSPGTLYIEGSNALEPDYCVTVLAGENTFTGGVIQRGGSLQVDNNNALGNGSYTVQGQARFGGTSGANIPEKILGNSLHLKATGISGAEANHAWILTSNITFNDDRNDNIDAYLYNDRQIITTDNYAKITFGENYKIADVDENSPTLLVIKKIGFNSGGGAPKAAFHGQNTFVGGVSLEGSDSVMLEIGSSSMLDGSGKIVSGPLGTGTLHFGAHNNHLISLRDVPGTSVHYVLHNNIELAEGNSNRDLKFVNSSGGGSSSSTLTLDSENSLDMGSIERQFYTGSIGLSERSYTLNINSRIEAATAPLSIRGEGYVRFNNALNNISQFNIGSTEYQNSTSTGRLSLGGDNVLGTGRIGVYGWSNFQMTSANQSYIQAYSGIEGNSVRQLDNSLDFHTGLAFESLIEENGIPGSAILGGIVTLQLNHDGYSDLNANLSGATGDQNQRLFTINSTRVSGSSDNSSNAAFNSIIVSFGETHDIRNGGMKVTGNTTNYNAFLQGKGGELELLGTKTFSGFTDNGAGSTLLGDRYDANSDHYALFVGDYGIVTTTLSDKDMVIGAVPGSDRVTPFGQGEILLNGNNAVLLVRTGDQKKDVYLEDAAFEAARGTFEVTGGGNLILGRKGDGSHFAQNITGRSGAAGQGILKATGGSSIVIDSGQYDVSLRTNMSGTISLDSGSLVMSMNNALTGETNLVFNGGTLNLNKNSQNLSSGGTLSLNSGVQSTLDFGGINSTPVLFTLNDLGTWNSDGALTIRNWVGNITGGGNSRILFANYTGSLYLGNVQFAGYEAGARFVNSGGYLELVPYSASYVWIGHDNNNWSNMGDNWLDRDVPNIMNAAVYFDNRAERSDVMLTSSVTVGSLTFNADTIDQFTIVPNSQNLKITMQQDPASGFDASINMSGTSDVLIAADLELKSHLNIHNASGADLEISGIIFNNNNDPRNVTKEGAGILTMSGHNNFSGSMKMKEGTLRIAVDEQFGASSVASGAVGSGTLEIHGGTMVPYQSDRTVSNRVEILGDFTVDGGKTLTLDYNGSGISSSMNDDAVITVADGTRLVIGTNNIFTGSGKLTKDGTGELVWNSVFGSSHTNGIHLAGGTLVLSAANSFTGGTEMAAGVLAISHNSALGNAGSILSVTGDSTLRIDANLTGVENNIELDDGKTLTVQTTSANNAVWNGSISGDGEIVKTGEGILVLTGDNDYAGPTSVEEGILQIGNGDDFGTLASNVALADDTSLVFNINGELSYEGIIDGSGNLVKKGTGNIILSGNSTYTGGSLLEAGTITAGHNNALGSGSLAMANGTTLSYADDISLANNINLSGAGALNVSAGSATQGGTVSGDSLSKTGTGTLILSGNNTYTGTTTVSEGVLQIGNGTSGSIPALTDGAKQVIVEDGAFIAFNPGSDISPYPGTITGEGGVIQRGNNTLLFTSAQDYSGGTIVEKGVVRISGDGSVGTSGESIDIKANGTFHIGAQAGDYDLVNTLTGDGTLVIDISEGKSDTDHFSFGSHAAAYGAGFTGTVEMRKAEYVIDNTTTAFLNGGTSVFRTTDGSIGSLAAINNTDPGQRVHRIDGTVEFAGGEMSWDFDNANQAKAYLSAGNIEITADTTFKLNLDESMIASCGVNPDNTSLFCDFVNGRDSLLLGVSDEAIAGADKWTDLQISVDGHAQTRNDSVRQNVAHASGDVAKGVFDWTVYAAPLASITELRAGYQLRQLEIFDGKTLEVLLTDAESSNNTFNIILTDYDDNSRTRDIHDIDTESRVGSGNVLFSDQTANHKGIYLASANSYTGTTTIDAGTVLILASDQALGSSAQHTSSLLVTESGAVLSLNNHTAHAGEVTVNNGGVINLGDNGNGTLNISLNTTNGKPAGNGGGTISGNNALTGKGNINLEDGLLSISGKNNSVQSQTTVAQGAILYITDVNALGAGDTAGTINTNGTFQVNAGGTLGNLVAGGQSGLWEKQGDEKLVSNRDNTFAGAILVSGGTLSLTGSNTATGSTELANGTVLELGRNDSAGSSQITMSGATGTIRALNDIAIANGISIAGQGTVDTNNKAVTSNGLISGTGSLVVVGEGSLSLNRQNSYQGNTTIDASTVILGSGGQDGLSSGNVTLLNNSVLELAFSNAAFDNVLTGTTGERVLVSGSRVTISANNNDFTGTWDITGSALISGLASNVLDNVGTDSTVSLNGGSLDLTVTDDADFTFTNKLNGTGRLNAYLGTNDNNFSFDTALVTAGANTFTGTLNMMKGIYTFSDGDRTRAGVLANGTLELGKAGSNVGAALLDGDYEIGGLTMNGGMLKIDTAGNGAPKGMLVVDTLNIDGGGTVALNVPDSISQTDASGTLFDDDGGPGSQQMQLVKVNGPDAPSHEAQLAFTNFDGSIAGNPEIDRNVQLLNGQDEEVAEAFYSYIISVKGDAEDPLSGENGIYLGYGLSRINSYETGNLYQLSNTAQSDNIMGAQLTSTARGDSADAASVDGGFEFKALGHDDESKVIISNAANNYTGKTLVSSGTVQYGANNAFGKTSELELAADTIVDLNGKKQTGDNAIGKLTMTADNSSLTMKGGELTVNDTAAVASGSKIGLGDGNALLTMTGGGTINGDNALSGSGTIDLAGSGREWTVNGVNQNLNANVHVRESISVASDDFKSLGIGGIGLAGEWEIRNADSGELGNTVTFDDGILTFNNSQGTQTGSFQGTGAEINLINESDISLEGGNAALGASDSFNIDVTSSLTAYEGANTGEAVINIGGLLTLDYSGDTEWTLQNKLNDNGQDAGEFHKEGSGSISIANANNRSGTTLINKGEIKLGNTEGLGSGAVTISNEDSSLTLNAEATGEFGNDIENKGTLNIASTDLNLSSDITGSGSIIARDGADVLLSGDNSGFNGEGANWNIRNGARVEMSLNEHLGNSASVVLDGFLKIDRQTVPVAGDFTWMNHFTGTGTMQVHLSRTAEEFKFDDACAGNIGAGFTGTLQLGQSTFYLGGSEYANTIAMKGATLESLEGNRTIIIESSGSNLLGGLIINGGTVDFISARIPGSGIGLVDDHITMIDTNSLGRQARDGAVANPRNLIVTKGTLAIEASLLNGLDTSIDTCTNILAQDDGRLGVKLVDTEAGNTMGSTLELEVMDSVTGQILTCDQLTDHLIDIHDSTGKVAVGYYNYGTTLGTENDGLYVDYKLMRVDIDAGKTLILDNKDASGAAADLNAQITGEGHLTIHASGSGNKVIALSNTNNTFTGITTVTNGTTLQAAVTVDNIIAYSQRFNMEENSTFDLNGTSQKVNNLNGAGQILFNGAGTLTVNADSDTDNRYTGDITGDGLLVKEGAGVLTLTGLVHHKQGSIVEEGLLNLTGTSAHAVNPLITLKGDGSAVIDGGNIGADHDVLFAADASNGSLTVANITDYTVGRDDQRILDATGTGSMDFILDNIKNARGDVYAASESEVNMVLKNNTNYTGKIDPVALSVDGTSVWNMTADSTLTDLVNNGMVDFTPSGDGTFKTLDISGSLSNDLNSTGLFGLNVSLATMESDMILVEGDVSGTYQLILKRDELNDLTDNRQFALKLVDVSGPNSGTATGETSFHGTMDLRMRQAKVQAGDLEGNNMEDWYLVYDHTKDPGENIGNTGRGVLGAAEVTLLWFTQMDSLIKRMGELRMNQPLSDNWVDNAWFRGYGSQYNVGSEVLGSRYRDMIYGGDLGVDKGWQIDRQNRVYTGIFGGYGGDQKDYKISGTDGETNSYYFGFYNTWINDCGCYLDVVAKGQYFDNSFKAYDESGNKSTGDYGNWGIGASVEFGKMVSLDDNWYIEPQVQLSYLHVTGKSYTTGGANSFGANLGGSDVLHVRYGANLGRIYNLRDGGMLQPYVKVEGVQQESRGGRIRTEDGQWRPNMDGAAVRVGTGVIWQIDPRNQLHFDYEAAFGERYNMPWSVNLGYRYQF